MRPARMLFLLLPLFFGCGSVQIILKPPVERECGSAGLKGCPALTEGALLYIEGQKAKGKDELVKGAAQNAPEKLKKFAQALKELDKIPGTAAYMKQVMEVADILASSPGSPGRKGRKHRTGPGPVVDIETKYAMGDVPGDTDGGIVAAWDLLGPRLLRRAPRVRALRVVATGPLVVTELSTDPACPVGMVAGAAKTAQTIDAPRWVARSPHGTTRTFVRDGESLFIGVQAPTADTHCALTWSAILPDD